MPPRVDSAPRWRRIGGDPVPDGQDPAASQGEHRALPLDVGLRSAVCPPHSPATAPGRGTPPLSARLQHREWASGSTEKGFQRREKGSSGKGAPRGTHRPPPQRAEHERARPSRSLRAEGPSSFLAGLRATVYRNAVWNGQAAPRGALPASPARSGRVHLVRGEGRDLSG